MATLTLGSASGQAGAQVGVPDIVGKPRAEAEDKLKALGLTPRVREVVADGDKDTVFSQDPPPRSIRPKGSVVTLQVVTVPATPPDLGTKLDELALAVAALETETAAQSRHEAVLGKLDEIISSSGGSGGAGGGSGGSGTGGSTSRGKTA
jgi:beta-lactam-binding protein with PASTA domain